MGGNDRTGAQTADVIHLPVEVPVRGRVHNVDGPPLGEHQAGDSEFRVEIPSDQHLAPASGGRRDAELAVSGIVQENPAGLRVRDAAREASNRLQNGVQVERGIDRGRRLRQSRQRLGRKSPRRQGRARAIRQRSEHNLRLLSIPGRRGNHRSRGWSTGDRDSRRIGSGRGGGGRLPAVSIRRASSSAML